LGKKEEEEKGSTLLSDEGMKVVVKKSRDYPLSIKREGKGEREGGEKLIDKQAGDHFFRKRGGEKR